ncbi:ATP-binding protein [Pseudomonas sp. SDI]|uniref:ATP-binding protein n=1 Tax=Pseudomonas sp. SDI TaxID=2170734 RepID=UPI002114457D|nr:ATP-binding protein [Pseudomonas sp. SDI]
MKTADSADVAPATASTAANDVSDIELLHSISIALIGEQDLQALYGKILDAAITIAGSQFGTMQLLCPPGHASGHAGELELLCSRGLPAEAVGFWQWVKPEALSSCAEALKRGQRAIIVDFEQWPPIAGTADLDAFLRTGIRSAQTTPLLSRSGNLLGMISTHWSQPHEPSERDLRLLDILARQAADLLERTTAEEALRQAQTNLRELNETLEQRVAERTAKLMQAEEQLYQSQKMEAVGQLTGGLAHDFNNLLSGISGALELMSKQIAEGSLSDIQKYSLAAQGAAKRAAALTHRLLAFSRRQTLAPRAVNVNNLMFGMTELIQRTAGPGIQLETLGSANLWPAFVDASQLENALLNLCINARDAMPEGGRISLRASNHWLDANAAQALALPEGHYLCLNVSDTGIGMPPEVMSRVFEPFFTTKPIGQGTGLGLSMIYGFAQQSGGQVRIDSAVGAGTSVSIFLPRHHGAPPWEEHSPAATTSAPAQRSETVMVVDDEPTVRMLLVDVLDELGYTVLEAADSAVGLELLRSTAPIDLLVADIGLPGGMNGRQLAEAGLRLRPAMKVLFITGYAEHSIRATGELQPGMQVLSKPFSVDSLGQRVQDMLAK